MMKIKKQQAVVHRKRKIFPERFSFRLKTFVKFLIGGVLLSVVGMGLLRVKYMFVDSSYFMIKEVDMRLYDENGIPRNFYINEILKEKIMGANILFIDLGDLEKRIEAARPEFKDVIVRRILPDKLLIEGKLRKAVAQIRSDRYYFVDAELILLPDVRNFPDPNLPIITGIGINLAKASPDKFSESERNKLAMSLDLINKVRSIKGLSEYKIRTVDITDPGNLTFLLEGYSVEIKIGNSDFSERLKTLDTVLDQLGQDIDKFKYIDLRFEDPIVGPL